MTRSPAQVGIMAHPRTPAPGHRRARSIAAPSRLHGVRPDRIWIRPGHEDTALADRPSADLVDALEWQHVRRGQALSQADLEVLEAVAQRSWGWHELHRRRVWSLPSWADKMIPVHRSAGYHRFLAALLAAFRSGACGILVSYAEAMMICGATSKATWQRWISDWEQRGLVRVVQTWRADPTETGRARAYDRLHYRLGPAWEACAGPGLVEGVAGDLGGPSAAWAATCAAGARRRVRQAREAEIARLKGMAAGDPRFARLRPPRGGQHAISSPPGLGDHSPPSQGGEISPAPPGPSTSQPKERPTAAHQATPPMEASTVPSPELEHRRPRGRSEGGGSAGVPSDAKRRQATPSDAKRRQATPRDRSVAVDGQTLGGVASRPPAGAAPLKRERGAKRAQCGAPIPPPPDLEPAPGASPEIGEPIGDNLEAREIFDRAAAFLARLRAADADELEVICALDPRRRRREEGDP